MSATGRCYVVCSPEYGEVIPVLDYGQGPIEFGCDVAFAYARNARRAKVLALRVFRRLHRRGPYPGYLSDNPFSGMTAKPNVCDHGQQYHCQQCDDELKREEELWKATA